MNPEEFTKIHERAIKTLRGICPFPNFKSELIKVNDATSETHYYIAVTFHGAIRPKFYKLDLSPPKPVLYEYNFYKSIDIK